MVSSQLNFLKPSVCRVDAQVLTPRFGGRFRCERLPFRVKFSASTLTGPFRPRFAASYLSPEHPAGMFPSGLFHTRTLIAITSPRINYRLSNYVLYTHPHITRYIGTAVRISKLILKQLLSYNFKKRARK